METAARSGSLNPSQRVDRMAISRKDENSVMTTNDKLRELLLAVFDELREGVRESVSCEEYCRMKEDFVFHMTDWRDDLEKVRDLYSRPGEWSTDDATRFLVGFMYHAVPHLTAAQNLLLSDSESKCPS